VSGAAGVPSLVLTHGRGRSGFPSATPWVRRAAPDQRRTYEGQVVAVRVTFIQQGLQRLCRGPQPLLYLRDYSMLSRWQIPTCNDVFTRSYSPSAANQIALEATYCTSRWCVSREAIQSPLYMHTSACQSHMSAL
jgi:hypothetical protein